MATAEVSIRMDTDMEDNIREQREILSRCFSEARRRLDERETQLSLQLEEIEIRNKKIVTDGTKLYSALQIIQTCLSSNSLAGTGNEAVKPITDKIGKLVGEDSRVHFNWSPQNLYNEINELGEISTIPTKLLQTSSCNSECNCHEPMNFKLMVPPPYEQQKTEFHSLLCRPLQTGDYWYLIHMRWFKLWKRYVGYDDWDKSNAGEEVIKPGPIDNTSLSEHDKLRIHQVDEIDYKLVPEEAWYKLLSWYGIGRGSMGIRRQVVEYGKYAKQCKVEVYPLELKSSLYPEESDFKIVTLSRCDTIHTLDKLIRQVYIIESTKHTRVYTRYMTHIYELIKDMNLEAQDVGLFDGQCVLLEVQNMDGTWPRTNAAMRHRTIQKF